MHQFTSCLSCNLAGVSFAVLLEEAFVLIDVFEPDKVYQKGAVHSKKG
jgi:hypothetical protein